MPIIGVQSVIMSGLAYLDLNILIIMMGIVPLALFAPPNIVNG